MKSNHTNVVAMLAALMLAVGCSDQTAQSAGEPMPAPSRSTDAAGKTVPSPQEDDGVLTPKEAQRSEFAALDTNSSGTLEENEWESDQASSLEGVKNMTFAQLDRNQSGGIEPEEFRKARTAGDQEADTGVDTAVGDSEPEEPGSSES